MNNRKNIESANPVQKENSIKDFCKKEHYQMFFTILISVFIITFWLCNYTKLKETFQIIMISGLSVAIAEYTTRRYFKI